MTEKQSKTKWCPMINLPNDEIKTAALKDICCLASSCMMWRWNNKDQISGYCGLAGKE